MGQITLHNIIGQKTDLKKIFVLLPGRRYVLQQQTIVGIKNILFKSIIYDGFQQSKAFLIGHHLSTFLVL